MLINTELNQLEKELRELKTREEKIQQIAIWLDNMNISASEYKLLMKYIGEEI